VFCSQKIVLFGCWSLNCHIMYMMLMHSVKTFFRPVKLALCIRKSSVSTLVTSGHRLILMLPMNVDIRPTLVWISGLLSQGNLNGSFPANIPTGFSVILHFSSGCSARTAWSYTCGCEMGVIVPEWWIPIILWGKCLRLVRHNVSRRWIGCGGPSAWPLQSPNLILWRQLLKCVYAASPANTDLVVILHTAVTTFDGGMLQCVQKNCIATQNHLFQCACHSFWTHIISLKDLLL
jgi:hypothetical protein